MTKLNNTGKILTQPCCRKDHGTSPLFSALQISFEPFYKSAAWRSLTLDRRAVTTKIWIAANALLVAWICCTLVSCWTWELSPPWSGSPQATTDPSARIFQQRHVQWPEPAGHLRADLWQQSCCHHSRGCPNSPQIHRQESQQMRVQWPEHAAHLSVYLAQQSYRHHNLDGPR